MEYVRCMMDDAECTMGIFCLDVSTKCDFLSECKVEGRWFTTRWRAVTERCVYVVWRSGEDFRYD